MSALLIQASSSRQLREDALVERMRIDAGRRNAGLLSMIDAAIAMSRRCESSPNAVMLAVAKQQFKETCERELPGWVESVRKAQASKQQPLEAKGPVELSNPPPTVTVTRNEQEVPRPSVHQPATAPDSAQQFSVPVSLPPALQQAARGLPVEVDTHKQPTSKGHPITEAEERDHDERLYLEIDGIEQAREAGMAAATGQDDDGSSTDSDEEGRPNAVAVPTPHLQQRQPQISVGPPLPHGHGHARRDSMASMSSSVVTNRSTGPQRTRRMSNASSITSLGSVGAGGLGRGGHDHSTAPPLPSGSAVSLSSHRGGTGGFQPTTAPSTAASSVNSGKPPAPAPSSATSSSSSASSSSLAARTLSAGAMAIGVNDQPTPTGGHGNPPASSTVPAAPVAIAPAATSATTVTNAAPALPSPASFFVSPASNVGSETVKSNNGSPAAPPPQPPTVPSPTDASRAKVEQAVADGEDEEDEDDDDESRKEEEEEEDEDADLAALGLGSSLGGSSLIGMSMSMSMIGGPAATTAATAGTTKGGLASGSLAAPLLPPPPPLPTLPPVPPAFSSSLSSADRQRRLSWASGGRTGSIASSGAPSPSAASAGTPSLNSSFSGLQAPSNAGASQSVGASPARPNMFNGGGGAAKPAAASMGGFGGGGGGLKGFTMSAADFGFLPRSNPQQQSQQQGLQGTASAGRQAAPPSQTAARAPHGDDDEFTDDY